MSPIVQPEPGAALRRAAVRATLAPSIRNTQPWRFVVRGTTLEVHADWDRRLRVVDPRGHQLLISCGAATFNARVSLESAGYEPAANRYPDQSQPDLVTRLTIGSGQSDQPPTLPPRRPIAELDPEVEARHTNRQPFTDEEVPGDLVDELTFVARAEDAELIALANTTDQLVAARLTTLADSLQETIPAYRAEMRAWAAGDPQRRDGVPGTDTRGTEWLSEVPPATVRRCLLLLGSAQDTPLAWVRVGEALQHVLLEITRRGYVASLVTQAVEVGVTNAMLRAELGLTVHPGLLLRVGRAPATVAARHRRLVDLIEYAGA